MKVTVTVVVENANGHDGASAFVEESDFGLIPEQIRYVAREAADKAWADVAAKMPKGAR